ncbi:MAG: DUF928 domain-containing protein [Microcoleaceae cyanobacterium]
MRYLLLIVTFVVAIGLKLLNLSSFLQKPALAINNLQNIRNTWQIAQTYIPPDRGAPKSTTTGGTRGVKCLLSPKQILPLLIPGNSIGLTLSEYPTFFVYIPPYKEAQTGEFFITDTNNNDIYNNVFQLPETSGIIKIKLPEQKAPPLAVGKKYIWGVQIICSNENYVFNTGFIERIEPNISLINKLKNARPLTLPTVYASEGIWYDALESLVELRRLNLENSQLINDWQELFNSAKSQGKDLFMEAPLLECCKL